MFKPLIKKVRENSTNPSILPENNTEEPHENSNKDNKNSLNDENSSSIRAHRRSASNAHQSLKNQSRIPSTSTDSDNKVEIVHSLSDIFSSYVQEPISINNFLRVITSWMEAKEKVLQEKDDTIQTLIQETINLQNELALFRNQFNDLKSSKEKSPIDNSAKVPYLQKQIDTLRSDNENLKSTIRNLRTQLSEVEAERDDLLIKSTDFSNVKVHDDFQNQLDKQKAENERHKMEIENLRKALDERDIIIEQQNTRLFIDRETQAVQTDEDKSFVEVLAEPDVDTISKLQAELDDKNRSLKNLQQRYNDLRKTLQREFHASIPKDLNQMASSSSKSNSAAPASPTNLPLIHYDSSATSQSDVDTAKRTSNTRQMNAMRKSVTFTSAATATTTTTSSTSAAILPHTSVESSSTKPQKNGQRSSVDGQVTLNGTNFKYLKHVLLKFMTSSEDEAIHLIRAVSTLLNFSADEERLLRETLDYKMSWFGKVSRHKPLVSNLNF